MQNIDVSLGGSVVGQPRAVTSIAQAVKKALEGNGKVSVRLGGSLAGYWVRDGKFQSGKQMFPGEGFGEIMGNAAMLNFGVAWRL